MKTTAHAKDEPSNSSKGEPSKHVRPKKPVAIIETSKTYVNDQRVMYDHKNYSPKPQKLPIILTDPNQDSLRRKAVYGPKRG